MSALVHLWPYVRRHGATLAVAYACMLVLGATSAFYAFLAGPMLEFVFSGSLVDLLRQPDGQLRSLWRFFPHEWVTALEAARPSTGLLAIPLLIVATATVKGAAQTGQFYSMGRVSQAILRALRRDTFAALLRQSPRYLATRAHGDLVSRLTNDVNQVEQMSFYGLAPLLREPIAIVFLLGLCFVQTPKLAFVMFVIVPFVGYPLVRFTKRLKRISTRGQTHQGALNAHMHEATAGMAVIQSFGAEQRELERLEDTAQAYQAEMHHSYFVRAVRTPTMEVLGAVALGALVAVIGYLVRERGADPAQFVSFFAAVMLMYDPIKKLGSVSDYLATGTAAFERVLAVRDAQPEIQDAPSAVTLPSFRRAVRFEGVSFQYGEAPLLCDVNLELRAGSMVALVGPSGAGKTTLANLLPRFYDVTAGRVLIDDHDVRDVTLRSLRAQMSLVSQETFLFHASVRDNLTYAVPNATPRDVRRAAEAAFIHDVIEAMPQGYDTIIGERGATLSGGQRQRLAIARAVLRDSPILILDEATSSLDAESEQAVQRALDLLMRDRTTLVIAHRLATVRRADLIVVLAGGRIVERGTHDALIQRGGDYARLCRLQAFESNDVPLAAGAGP